MTLLQTIEKPKTISPVFVTRRPAHLGESLLSRIGNTPLLPLHRLAAAAGVNPDVLVFAKAEWFNASGSVKARPALFMIEAGERSGQLTPAKTIIDATSGNTGIALAMIGAVKGYKVKLVMPANVSSERKSILKAYGAELVLTDPLEGIDLSIRTAQQLAAESPDLYFRPDQYNNPVNWQAHYQTTGVEIWDQTGGAVTHFVAGIGTSGTLMGTGRRLKDFNSAVEVIAVEPADELAIIEGLKHMETSIVPGIFDPHFADRTVAVYPNDAHELARRLAREEGMFVGYSAGAAAWAALQVAKTLTQGVVVTVFPDGGEKYLSVAD
ncbi:MAG: PLP-dependent cysteine synthase family protein [Anaerolineales bacterium]|nr:PLP-dependent cysteine synthase family protein [Anaerolineales bacterium]